MNLKRNNPKWVVRGMVTEIVSRQKIDPKHSATETPEHNQVGYLRILRKEKIVL